MITIEVSSDILSELNRERFDHAHPLVQRRCWAVWLKASGYSHGDIATLLQITMGTVTEYLKLFAEEGMGGLRRIQLQRRQNSLSPYAKTLEEYFRNHPPATRAQAVHAIETLTGVRRSECHVGRFLRGMGMTCRKVGTIPAKADPLAQEVFKKNR